MANKKNKLLALVLLSSFILFNLFYIMFTEVEQFHHCNDHDHCVICHVLSVTTNDLQHGLETDNPFINLHINVVIGFIAFILITNHKKLDTLVSLSVKKSE